VLFAQVGQGSVGGKGGGQKALRLS